jgi:hypothetical protein
MVNLFYLDKDPKKCAQYYCDKHVNKILIEIGQILSQIHHLYGTKTPPYKSCKAVSKNLKPLRWAFSSKSNYLYCCDLGKALLDEYKFRYQKDSHKCEKVIQWLTENIPSKIEGKRRTKFLLTDNVSIYSEYFKDPVEASRYMYVDFKCKNDNWSRRGKPIWFDLYKKKSEKEKEKLKYKIMINVREKLPELSRRHKLKVRRFHSFLRVCYDELFQDKWDRKIKTMKNMFDPNKPLIDQLGVAHLRKVYEISNLIFDLEILDVLNNNSLRYRNKLKKKIITN